MKLNQFWALPLELLALIGTLKVVLGSVGLKDCLRPAHLGTECRHRKDDPRWPKPDCKNDQFFYDCVSGNVIQQHKCQPLDYGPRKFNGTRGICVPKPLGETQPFMEFKRYKRQTGSSNAGSACRFNTDCLDGMYCNSGLCTCLSNYVQEGSYCYEQINPTQSGCIYASQCSAVWPGATCTSAVCTCPTTAPRSVETRDGFVCARNVDECPLPALYGSKSVLKYTGTGTSATCTYGSTTALCMSAATGGYSVAEMYDCLQGATTGVAVCCPNRAYACTQKLENGSDGGTTGTTVSRWYYNSLTGTCSTFTFYVSGSGNSNNFETQASCQAYCANTCPRGPTQYATTSTVYYSNKAVSCQGSSSTCTSNYQCTAIGSNQICCPTASFICSQNGGLLTTPPTQTTIYNPGYTTQNALNVNQAAETRYYYDPTTRSCLTYSFLGTAGNFNNFRSRTECQQFCSLTVCDRGTPLRDSTGVNQACSSNSQCPTTHTCNNNVCCPSKQTICSQTLRTGTACSTTSFGNRYWYNALTRQCEQFTFGGCNGNDNNFASQLACQQYCTNAVAEPICQQGSAYKDNFGNFYQCSTTGIATNCPVNYECYYDGTRYGCCPTQTYTCALPSAVGRSCGPQTSRWYYDTTTQACSTFLYNGCDGNSNNFANRELCQNYCGSGTCPNNGSPYVETSGAPRVCSSAVTCPTNGNYECTNVVLSTSTQVNYCCPTRASTCSQPPLSGNTCGSGSVTRYYFSTSTRQCATFTYNGCGGNSNNFATLSQCQNFCNSAACNAGEAVYINPTTSSSLTCNANIASTCPAGYTCRYDSVSRNNVCCGSTDGGVCPNGERAYIDSLSQGARTCTPSSSRPCPGTYLCRLSTTANRYYCCAPSSTTQCPNGFATYLSPVTNLPQVCTLGTVANTCPNTYSCQTRVIGSFQGYCCSTTPLCPTGMSVYQTTTGRPQSCTFGGPNVCPSTYQCQTSTSGSFTGYCCSATASRAVCTTSAPYLLNNSPVVCNAQSATNQCPSGYSCQLYAATNTYYCCAGSGGTGICQSGTPYLDNNIARTCSPSVASCPLNYNCQRARTGNAYYCCSGASSTVCGTAAFPYQPGGVPVSCTINDNRCPAGYNCQLYSATNTYYCCQPTTAICRVGTPSLLNGTPQSCSPNAINSCPAGFTCTANTGVVGVGNTFYCCSGGATGNCPNGGIQTAQTCSPNVASSCINGQCQFIPGTNRYQCCTNAGSQACPTGGTTTGQVCSPNVPNTCGVGGSCQLIAATNRYQCCGNSLANACPSGGTTTGRVCSPSVANSCGFGNTCQRIVATNRFECCTNTGATGVCPSGGTTTGQVCSPNLANTCGTGTCQLIAATNRYQCCTTGAVQQRCPQGGTLTGANCSPNIAGSCPGVGASCQLIAATGRYQCCANAVQGTCPQGGTLTQNFCSPNVAGSCPGGTCQQIAATGRYQCCTGAVVQRNCPDGTLAYTNPATQQTQTCIPNIVTSCPNTYTCTTVGTQFVCCQAAVVQATCPNNAQIYTNPTTRQPQACTAGTLTCPTGFSCQTAPGSTVSYCCTSLVVPQPNAAQCPAGRTARTSPLTGQPQFCTPNTANNCPAGFSCTLGVGVSTFVAGQTYLCCSGGVVNPGTTGVCNNGNAYLYPGTNLPLICTRFGNSCPSGYTCQQSTTAGRSYCCGAGLGGGVGTGGGVSRSNGCARGNAFMQSGTNTPQTCFPNQQSNCPFGYSCSYSFQSFRYQCCSSVFQSEPDQGHSNTIQRNQPEQLSVTKESEIGLTTTLTTQKPKKMCTRGRCKAGEYGCRKRADCTTNLCEDGRCTCPTNMMISQEGNCVKHCGNKFINENGECVMAPGRVVGLPFGDSESSGSHHFLSTPCSNETSEVCTEKQAYCNIGKELCQCYATYESRGGVCVLSPEFRKNNTKSTDELKS